MSRRTARSDAAPVGLWVLGLAGIGLAAWGAVAAMGVSLVDHAQQQDLVELLAKGDLARSLAVGDPVQTSGPGFGLFGVPIHWVVRPFASATTAYDIVAFATLVPLAVAAVAASRSLGVVARSGRELLNVAAVVLGVPVLACFSEAFHPADALAAAACLGAFAAVASGRIPLAALLLGFAVATRQWAVVGVLVLAVLLRGRDRWLIAGGSAGVAAAIIAPFLIADPRATLDALRAADVVRGELTAAAFLPLDGPGLYLLSRYVPLLLVAVWCLWLRERRAEFAPELGMAALAVAFLLRPVVDPAGYLYYLAPGYACWVLIRPRSWAWPVVGLAGGLVLWLRHLALRRYPTYIWDDGGSHLQVVGGAAAVGTTLVIVAATEAAIARAVQLTRTADQATGAVAP